MPYPDNYDGRFERNDWKAEEQAQEQSALVEKLHKAILKSALAAYAEYQKDSYVHHAEFDSLMAGIKEAVGECVYSSAAQFQDCDWYGSDITEGDLK